MSYVINKVPFEEIEIITTTRSGGFSEPPFDTFNMAYDVGDNPEHVLKNRNQLFKELNIEAANCIIPNQKNGDSIIKIESIIDGRDGDGFYTYDKNIALSVIHSNCVPIFIYVPSKGLIGALHASTKGTFLEITRKFIKLLKVKEHIDPNDIYAFFGPGISFMHIDATEKDIKRAENMGYLNCCKIVSGNAHLDINLMNYLQLRKEGVPSSHINQSTYDTYDNSNLFFSKSRNNVTGRMISVIRFV